MKSRLFLGLALAVIALPIPFFGEETVTIRLSTTPWVPMGCENTTGNPSCGFWSADDPTKIVYVFLTPNTECTQFLDPVPHGGRAVSIDLKFPYVPFNFPTTTNVYVDIQSVLAQSYLLGPFTPDVLPPAVNECDDSRPTLPVAMFQGPRKAGGIPNYHYGGLNDIDLDPISEHGWEYVDVTVHYEPPRVVQFDVTNETPELQRRMLIHNSRSTYPYPSVNQVVTSDTERPQYTISGHVTSGSHGVETDLWLRVLDPADPSPYLPSDMQHDDDNMDTKPRGTLLPISCAAPPCVPSDSLQAHTTADGAFSARLEGTDRYAGDNYVIEAGEDADFSCSTGGPGKSNICARSGTITAWKRIFVEKQKMLRNGISLTADAHAGDTSIRVADNHYGGNQGRHARIGRGDRIVLVHGPAFDRSNLASGSYYEEHTVESVARGTNEYVVNLGVKSGNLVTLEHLTHDFGRDPSNRPFLADSIAALVGTHLSADDCFDAADNLFTNVFAEAFTEYVILPDAPSGFVPVPNFGSTKEPDLQAFADKWSVSVGTDGHAPPNHQLLLIADNDRSNVPDAGVTVTQVPGETSSWVWRGTIETQVATHGAVNEGNDPNLWAAKNAAHELAHEWKTDTIFNLVDHCPATTKTYNDSSLYCLLATNSTGGAETQRANGIARFHLLPLPGGGWHSEYFEIRRHPDPFVP